ncbi:MAG: tRNA pseudouridine(13) synthase TruD [Candidatus Aenigmatarchaeota archaeon]
MVKIKQIPEDFVVKEIFEKKKFRKGEEKGVEKGYYVWFDLTKKNYDLFRCIKILAKKLGVSIKRFGYAGVKDKRAITTQKISVWNVPIEKLKDIKLKDIELSNFEIKNERINLGDLKGNYFEITIRDIHEKDKEKIEEKLKRIKKEGFVNFFGEQRFGIRKNTHAIGKAIIKNDLKNAVWLYLTDEGEEKEEIKKFRKFLKETKNLKEAVKICPKNLRYEKLLLEHLISKPNDYAGALRKLPKKLRLLFIHAYQAYLWNEIARVSKAKIIPLIGFKTKISEYEDAKTIEKILEKEGVSPENFKIKSMPELASEGGERKRIVKAKKLQWSFNKDELNECKIKCIVKFELESGVYATVFLENVIKIEN